MNRRLVALVLSGVALVAPACSALRDSQPFTVTVSYDRSPGGGAIVTPLKFDADNAFGEVQVVNNTDEKRGFAIDDLAVFETIPAGQSKLVSIQEAKNNRTYTFYDQLHPKDFEGQMVVKYVAEEER